MSEILIVDDSFDDAELARRVLNQHKVKNPVRWICDGEMALEYLNKAQPPAILLLDLKLPRISGFEILDRLREKPGFSQILRMVFSSVANLTSIKEAYKRGANSFASKPLRSDDLQEMIKMFPDPWRIGDAGVS